MQKYTFFYDGGAEGGLSQIDFNAYDEDEAWEKWNDYDDMQILSVRLMLRNAELDIIYQE